MPARPSHIPHARERSTLQKMSAIEGLPIEKMHPAGKHTVAGMMAGSNDGQTIADGLHIA